MKQRWELEVREVKGVPLLAPWEYWALDDRAKGALGLGGCGPGGIGDFLVPDTVWGLSIRPACEIHDYMYADGRTWDDKRLADKVFLANMVSIVRAKTDNAVLRWLRLQRVRTYYRAVRDFGAISFHGREPLPGSEGDFDVHEDV